MICAAVFEHMPHRKPRGISGPRSTTRPASRSARPSESARSWFPPADTLFMVRQSSRNDSEPHGQKLFTHSTIASATLVKPCGPSTRRASRTRDQSCPGCGFLPRLPRAPRLGELIGLSGRNLRIHRVARRTSNGCLVRLTTSDGSSEKASGTMESRPVREPRASQPVPLRPPGFFLKLFLGLLCPASLESSTASA